MQLIVPLLVDMGVNAAWVSAAVLSARVALFAHRFIKSRSL
jgi:hypothetical protein